MVRTVFETMSDAPPADAVHEPVESRSLLSTHNDADTVAHRGEHGAQQASEELYTTAPSDETTDTTFRGENTSCRSSTPSVNRDSLNRVSINSRRLLTSHIVPFLQRSLLHSGSTFDNYFANTRSRIYREDSARIFLSVSVSSVGSSFEGSLCLRQLLFRAACV